MRRRLKPFYQLEGAQASASDPLVHASLSASAGTGKTHVLTSRVLRLLLRGTPPSSILCLTFTKAGAAEMANRLGERLAHWVRLPDAELSLELKHLCEDFSPPMRDRARRLFAQVLDAPGGGLRIQTIHSFAQTLLASFPAEAEISPGLKPVEGRAEEELARRTLAALLEAAEEGENRQLIDDVSAISLRLGEFGAERYLMDCARAHDAMEALGEAGSIESRLMELIGIAGGDPDVELQHRLSDAGLDILLIEQLAAANLAWSTSTGDKIVANLTAFLAADPKARRNLLASVGGGLVTKDGIPCKVTAKQIALEPDYEALVADFAGWLGEIRTLVAASTLAKTQTAGLRAGQAFAKAYARAKRTQGVADFNDLIAWTRRLFDQPGMGEWVRYKLDQRTDHILVDEAQDTNADQWAIVDALAGEFFTGNPEAENRWRTLFMVGDYKQAIYSFQGTDPKEFEAFRASISARAEALVKSAAEADGDAREFRQLSIDASFRSSPPVLEVVDAVIDVVGFDKMGLGEPPNPHRPHHSSRPGRVELWPAFEAAADTDADEGEEAWIDEPARLYADALARQVRRWLAQAPVMASTGRPLSPGDILILVRSRTELASLIVARLYAQGVPVAGIDRLHLHKPLAVKDLLSAITFAVQPLDDLNLAALLVSPLIGWTQEQLYELAFDRGGRLWTELATRRESYPHWAEAHDILSGWLAMADYVTPARFLETILSGPLGGRQKLLSRLGEAARDPIEELVATALAFEREEIASLDRFLAWFGQGEVEVKRDPGAPTNAVRVMTVHGAKGLEAPLVILADAAHDPDKVGGTSSVLEVPLPGIGKIPFIRPRKDECAPIFRALIDLGRASGQEEHWRLAYVGLTRAAERLVIAGVKKPKRDVPQLSWHAAAGQAMQAIGAASVEIDGWGPGLVWEGSGTSRPSAGKRKAELQPIAIPDFLRQPAPIEARPPRPLAPSQIVEDSDTAPPPSPEMREAARRGSLLHALFERLPGVDPSERMSLALKWLQRSGVEGSTAEEIATSACSVIADPAYAELFSPEALAEAPIAAALPDGRVIAGTVDRLCVGEERVRVIDFKTGRHVPSGIADVPRAHRVQMEAYTEALKVIFPGRRIEASLLYTAGPMLIDLTG
ncbi:double-strand break repair helicase AddA [Sphingomonas sp. NSE70-1]|uniref:DNA 3'-5' helicase n=1 Tax=Sphingomonas caseinilyticus TaxID=2908205 RepID=A0ABT0RRH7_9SPHN|nr:double-strand break repair helicase AddA [Sphingomonas caseinilyticus]MCL6697612.1 double-strand break repair helicase AddA [Sphingomonas caseinilyticus]